MHHIASDGWSVGVLMRDLADAYAARRAGGAPQWPELPVQYVDYALWQRSLLGGHIADAAREQQMDYWASALTGLPGQLDLPLARRGPVGLSRRGAVTTLDVDANSHAGLLRLAREHHVTLFMVMQAVFAVLLSRSGAGADIPIGTPVADRTDEAVHELVGFFLNTLVLRTDVSGNPCFAELLDRVRETDLAAYAHQDVPFDHLVEVLNPARSAARHPLFQVMLVCDDVTGATAWQLPGLDARAEPVDLEAAKFDLTLSYRQRHATDGAPSGISLVFEYSLDVFDAAAIDILAARLTLLLQQVIEDPDRKVAALDVMTAAERQRLLAEWNS